ncbi:MAG: thermonuclease family protein [Gaiellaceae bacterium]
MTRISPFRLLAPALLAVVLVACDSTDTAPLPPDSATIARVADGDSLVLQDGARVRLLQIDAPELGGGECHGREASRELSRLLEPGDRVRLELDPELDDRDRHGRLLRYVHLEVANVNVELVRRGAAAPFFLRGERGRYADDLLSAVEDAQRASAGMWQACDVRWSSDRQVETRPRSQ